MGLSKFFEWFRGGRQPSQATNARSAVAPRAAYAFAKTAREVTQDPSYAHVWTSPGSHIAYYVKAVLTQDLQQMTDPPLHRRIVLEDEPESYMYVGILDGQLVNQVPKSDLTTLGLRVSLGTGLPFIKNKPRTL